MEVALPMEMTRDRFRQGERNLEMTGAALRQIRVQVPLLTPALTLQRREEAQGEMLLLTPPAVGPLQTRLRPVMMAAQSIMAAAPRLEMILAIRIHRGLLREMTEEELPQEVEAARDLGALRGDRAIKGTTESAMGKILSRPGTLPLMMALEPPRVTPEAPAELPMAGISPMAVARLRTTEEILSRKLLSRS